MPCTNKLIQYKSIRNIIFLLKDKRAVEHVDSGEMSTYHNKLLLLSLTQSSTKITTLYTYLSQEQIP